MATKGLLITVKGTSALLMHAYPMIPIEGFDKLTPAEQAEHAAYREPKSRELYVPSLAMQRACIAGAVYSKGKGRGSLQKNAAACLQISSADSPEYLFIGTQDYIVDSRPVVIPATKGRVMRHRPRIDAWSLTFEIEYDPTLLSEEQVNRILDDTGSRVGILDFRPEKKGPFGRFIVTSRK